MRFTRLDDETLEVCLTRERSLNEVFELLSSQGIRVASLRNKQSRLEQMFLDITGRNKDQGGRE